MTLTVAEMYVQGVSTRNVTAVVQELCGLDITSKQEGRAVAALDEQLGSWRCGPIGEITHLILDARYEKADLCHVFDADESAEAERRLHATNGLERLNKEIKRRTWVATLFPNKASLLRLASAVLLEISDDWETEHTYLTMEAR